MLVKHWQQTNGKSKFWNVKFTIKFNQISNWKYLCFSQWHKYFISKTYLKVHDLKKKNGINFSLYPFSIKNENVTN